MKISKAIITAAARNQRQLPQQTLIDRDGGTKSVLRILAEEAFSAGVEEVGVVVVPGDQEAYALSVGDLAGRLKFIEQPEARGYGHALWCARHFTGSDAFLHLVSDHLFVSRSEQTSARQLVDVASAQKCSVSAVQATRENMLPYYGVVGGRHVQHSKNLYQIEKVREKPTPTEAEQNLIVPGLRAGFYLCFYGMHVLSPIVMELLDEGVRNAGEKGTLSLSSALARLAERERYLALELPGRRYNVGVPYGLFLAQMALALEGRDREEVLAQMLELLAARSSSV